MQEPSPLLTVDAASALVALSAGIGSWRRRREIPAAPALAVVMAGLTWWAGWEALQTLMPDGPVRDATIRAIFVGVAVVVAGFYLEARLLADRDWRPTRRTYALLSIHPILLLAVVTTDPARLFILSVRHGAGLSWLPWTPGPLFWLHTAYCYAMLTWCFVHLARARRGAGPLHRRQLTCILLAGLIPTVANVVTIAGARPEFGPELGSCFFVVTGVVHYYAVFRLGLYRLVPVARGLVLDRVSDAIYVLDTTGQLIDVNPAGQALARWLVPGLPAELIGLPGRRLVPHDRRRRALADGQHHVERDGGARDLDLRISTLTDRRGDPLGTVVVVRDVTEITAQRRELTEVNGRLVEQLETIDRLRRSLAEQAVRDELTGLHNRRHLITRLNAELDVARGSGTDLAVIVLDIDHFKAVNDRYGHAVGDHLLVATAQALVGCVREGDTVARYGGEEFVVLLPGAGVGDALATAEALRRCCASVLVTSRSGPVSATLSAGVAAFRRNGDDGPTLLQSADEALYAAKDAGRDRVIPASA